MLFSLALLRDRGGGKAEPRSRDSRRHYERAGVTEGPSAGRMVTAAAPGREADSGPGPRAPGREGISTHPWALWSVPGEGRRPLTPGALGWALPKAVGRAHGGARSKHRPERPTAGRQRRENGLGWPSPGAVAEASSWSCDAGKGGREAHARERGQCDGVSGTSLLRAKSAHRRQQSTCGTRLFRI